jgi:AAA family ATP:ADP antiporter
MLLPVSHCLQVLFTVVPREEKYSAKLVIDTVVQRLGDAIAAAAFQVLGKRPVRGG